MDDLAATREEVGKHMIAAWNNVPVDKVMSGPANEWTERAWTRVYVTAAEPLAEALAQILRCDMDGNGLMDCIDNTGQPYQSADLHSRLETALERLSEFNRNVGASVPDVVG